MTLDRNRPYARRLRPPRPSGRDLDVLAAVRRLLDRAGRDRMRLPAVRVGVEAGIRPNHAGTHMDRLEHLGLLGCERCGNRVWGGHWWWLTSTGLEALEGEG